MEGLTGKMSDDVPLAMERAGLESYDEVNMMWHHFQDTMIRMLVSRNVQSVRTVSIGHSGGRAVVNRKLMYGCKK